MKEIQTPTETFNAEAACAAQKALVEANEYPHFAPSDGRCYDCRRQIYDQIDRGLYKTGISVESAAISLVTGCPHCHFSYCE